jgi:small-conductance mechanosensitive channel/CRP-like cAMP-binding protein
MAPDALHGLIGLALGLAAIVLRATSVNQLVRRRLWLSIALLAAYVGINVALVASPTVAGYAPRLRSLEQLLIVLALVNGLVYVAVNPLRHDRVPDRFPSILQDTIVVAVFLVVSTFVFEEKLLTTSAVGAVVIGFALQDTLGNAIAGLAIQIEKPFHVGHWVRVGEFEGRVHEVTWRATKLRTKTGNLVVLPNNVVSKEAVTNYSEPALPTRHETEVGATYLRSPGDVKAALREALAQVPLVLAEPAPEVLLVDFGSSAITYRVRFWVADYARDEAARDQVRSAIWYAFQRHDIEIPWPIQVEYTRQEQASGLSTEVRAALLRGVEVLAPLSDGEQLALAAAARERIFGGGEAIVREGAPGRSLFVVAAGAVRVSVEPGDREVARLGAGACFGEMSMLTGDPRTATVTAAGDCRVLEITDDVFRPLAVANPGLIDVIGRVALERRKGLQETKDAAAAARTQVETPLSLAARIRKFLRLA